MGRTSEASGLPWRNLEQAESSEGGGDSHQLPCVSLFHLLGCTGNGAAMIRQYVSYASLSQRGFDLVVRYLRGTIPGLRPKGLEGLWRIQCIRLLMGNRSTKQELRSFQLDGVHLLLMKCIRDPKMRNTQFHNLQPPSELNLPQDDL